MPTLSNVVILLCGFDYSTSRSYYFLKLSKQVWQHHHSTDPSGFRATLNLMLLFSKEDSPFSSTQLYSISNNCIYILQSKTLNVPVWTSSYKKCQTSMTIKYNFLSPLDVSPWCVYFLTRCFNFSFKVVMFLMFIVIRRNNMTVIGSADTKIIGTDSYKLAIRLESSTFCMEIW